MTKYIQHTKKYEGRAHRFDDILEQNYTEALKGHTLKKFGVAQN